MSFRSRLKEKRCLQCDLIKSAEDFNKGMKRCKNCQNSILDNDCLQVSHKKTFNSERERHREKYHRLGYKDKQVEWNKDKPWTKESIYKSLRSKYYSHLDRNFELHHWNYNNEYLTDVFILDIKDHKKLHKYLNLDLNKKLFFTEKNNYLDTREKHENFIKSLDINIEN